MLGREKRGLIKQAKGQEDCAYYGVYFYVLTPTDFRWPRYDYEDLTKRYNASLDIFGLRDQKPRNIQQLSPVMQARLVDRADDVSVALRFVRAEPIALC